MAEVKSEIELKVDYDRTGLRSARRDFRDFSRDVKRQGMASRGGGIPAMLGIEDKKWKKHFDSLDKATKAFGNIALKGLMLSLKGVVLEMGLMGAAMVGIHAAFALGNVVMKAMKASLGPLAAGMTAIVAAGSAAAAAVREQQAAMWAYKNTAKGEFGSGLNQVRQQMRALETDSYLATAGVKNLNTVFATVSKTGTFTASSQNLLRGLMDFASAGQPLEEGVKKAGDLIAILQDSKKSFSQAKVAAQGLFPDKAAMDKALKELKINTKKGLEEAINSGDLAAAAGVEGQFEAVSGTLINRVKGYFNVLKSQFADLGQPLLEPLKHAAYDIFRILQRGFVRIGGATQRFGMKSMLEGLVTLVDKLTTKATDLINNNLKSAEGTFDKMGSWWGKFTYGWGKVTDALRPFIDGARVIEKMFGRVWIHVKEIGASRFGDFNEWLQQNESTVLEFGDNVGELIKSIMGFQSIMSKLFQDMLPFINSVVSGITSMVEQLTSFIGLLRGLGGNSALGSLAVFAGMRMGLGAMKGTKGGFIGKLAPGGMAQQNTQNMEVNAQSVVLHGGSIGTTGAAVGGSPGTPGGPGTGGSPSRGGGTPVATGPSGGRRGLFSRGRGLNTLGTTGGTTMASPWGAPTPGTGVSSPTRAGRFGNFMRGAGGKIKSGFSSAMQMDTRDRDEVMNASSRRQVAGWMRQQRSESRFGTALFGSEDKGIKGLNNSMTGKMGVGMGLAAMSSVAPEEAQGALALGGSLAMINPMLGLGVGLGGAALKSKTATGGAMMGIGGGAAMGAMVAGPVGAAVGAVLGGVTGAIMGTINRKKAESKAAKAAAKSATESILDVALSGIFEAVRNEDGTGRSATRDAFSAMKKQQDKVLGVLGQAPGNLSGGMGGRFMQSTGLRGNTITKGIEDLTGKEIPGFFKAVIGVTTSGISNAMNLAGTVASKFGLKRFINNRKLNPLGFGATNRDDVRTQKQKGALGEIYRNQKQYGMSISESQYKDMLKKPGESIETMQKDIIANQTAMGPLQDKYNSRLDTLSKLTGKSDQEVISLAKTMGVNLFDSTVSLEEQMAKLGLTTTKTAEQFNTSLINGFTSGMSVFDKEIKRLKAPRILDETARAFGDMVRASKNGMASEEQKVEFMKSVAEQNLSAYNSAGQAFAQTQLSFQKGGTAYAAGGPLSDLKDQKFYETKAYKDFVTAGIGTLSSEGGAQLNSVLASTGSMIDTNQLRTQLEKMDPKQQAKFADMAAGGFKELRDMSQEDKTIMRQQGMQGVINKYLGPGLDVTRFKDEKLNLDNMAEEVATQTTILIEKMGGFFEDSKDAEPEWYKTEPLWWSTLPPAKDTSTPRGSRIGDTTSSRLSQTMSRHASMNGMLTGKRTVTSAYRTTGLGSMNSDHVTGRAYDLVGQNLGQYQSLVRAGGGFAEYHGVNRNRHLHVVPGPGMGDNSSPVSVSSNQTRKQTAYAGSSSGGNTYQFYVTGSQNASANEIAEIVMQKVKDTERSNRERM
jgi:hypothetical protein